MTKLFIKMKHRVFRYFGVVSTVLTLAVIGWLWTTDQVDLEKTVPLIALWFSLLFFVQKQKLEELRLFKELFVEFNRRYDQMNESLMSIRDPHAEVGLTDEQRERLIDYFNLCSEEYLYYRLGYIYPEVWEAWSQGMADYFEDPRIKRLWEQESDSGSYYGLKHRH